LEAQPPQETSEVSRTGALVTDDHPLSGELCATRAPAAIVRGRLPRGKLLPGGQLLALSATVAWRKRETAVDFSVDVSIYLSM